MNGEGIRVEEEEEEEEAEGEGEGEEEVRGAFQICEDALLGRHLVADRDLGQGDLIIKEKPIVLGPSRDSDLCCLGCFRVLEEGEEEVDDDGDDDGLGACERCGLPVCGDESFSCQDAPAHAAGECAVLMSACAGSSVRARSRTSKLLGGDLGHLYDVVLLLKCLSLRSSSPSAWRRLLGMSSHARERSEDEEAAERADRSRAFVLGDLDLGVGAEELDHLLGVLDVNSFEVPPPPLPGEGVGRPTVPLQAVYDRASHLEHSCVPNVHRSVDADAAFAISVRAAVDVPAGSHLATIYTDSLWTTRDRRRHLLSSKYFSCRCERCRDPTELGTYLSALRCARCHHGWVLPDDPVGDDGGGRVGQWSCDACLSAVSAERVDSVTDEVSRTVSLLDASPDPSADRCAAFLRIHAGALHPAHAHMTDVRHTMMHLLGREEGRDMAALTDAQLREKEEAARAVMAVGDRLLPGLSRLRGTTSYELFLVYQQRAVNWMGRGERGETDIGAACNTARQFLAQCCSLLRFEPASSAEGKLCLRAREELEMLEAFMAQRIQ